MMVVATTDQLMELDRRNMMFFKNYWMLEVVDPGDEGQLDSRVLQDQTEEVYLANSDENSCDFISLTSLLLIIHHLFLSGYLSDVKLLK